MNLEQLKERQKELTKLLIDNSNFGILRAKKDINAELVESIYYKFHAEFNQNRILINKILDSKVELNTKTVSILKKEPREIMSTTYIRAQTKFSNEFDRYFKR